MLGDFGLRVQMDLGMTVYGIRSLTPGPCQIITDLHLNLSVQSIIAERVNINQGMD